MVIGIIQLTFLIFYEVILALVSGAYKKMPKSKKILYLLFALLPLALMTMFHSSTVGNDTIEYIKIFEAYKNSSMGEMLNVSRFEPGYLILNVVIGTFTDNSQWIFIIIGSVLYYSLGRWLNKYIDAPGLTVILLVELLVVDGWMSAQRFAIAFAILLFAFDFLVDKRIVPFVILVVVASLFHRMAISFLLAYPLINLKKNRNKNAQIWRKKEIIVFGSAIMVTIFEDWIIGMLIIIFPVYSYYLGSEYTNGEVRVAVILQTLIYLSMLIIPRVVECSNIRKDKGTECLHGLALLNIFFSIVSLNATIMHRLSSLFLIFTVAYYTESVGCLKNGNNKRIIIMASIILFACYAIVVTVMRTPEWQTTYPFSWCW